MKNLFILYILVNIGFHSHCFEINKISEFAGSEKFITGQSGLLVHRNYVYALSYSGLLIFELNEKGIPSIVNKIRLC